MEENVLDYTDWVVKAVSEIGEDQYTKVIVSRAVDLEDDIDMLGTLLWGRHQNTPARTFSLCHEAIKPRDLAQS